MDEPLRARPIGDILAERTIILDGADLATAQGFTQIPNHLLVDKQLSSGAKLVYAMLLRYAWQNSFCYPGQERLAKDIATTDRQVRNHLHDLEHLGYITVKRRGQGKTNVYVIHLRASSRGRRAA